MADTSPSSGLVRNMGLLPLTATGICSMLGASINVVPFMIQRNVPGIGQYVIPAFLFAAIPAILAAFAYAILASGMPRAGGSYVYASRGLHPYLGFIASFSQWFGLSIVIGVISYIIIPFVRDVAIALNYNDLGTMLEMGWIRVGLALLLLWGFVLVNFRGAKTYERTLIPLMILMFVLGAIVIIAGSVFNQDDFIQALSANDKNIVTDTSLNPFKPGTFVMAGTLLFSSFIGFDSIAQAGGEARNPGRSLPLAIGLAIFIVGSYYVLFTWSVYHAVPWQFVAHEAMQKDISAPGLLSYLLPGGLAAAILIGAAIALINDLPAMLLSVSRMMFAWAEDGIFPREVTRIHKQFHTPSTALLISGLMASIGILGSHFAGDFFLGIDIMVTSMMVNFLLICITLITIPKINHKLFDKIQVLKNRTTQLVIGWSGSVILIFFLAIHTYKDLSVQMEAWYFHSTPIWLIVMFLGSLIYGWKIRNLKRSGQNTKSIFQQLPPE